MMNNKPSITRKQILEAQQGDALHSKTMNELATLSERKRQLENEIDSQALAITRLQSALQEIVSPDKKQVQYLKEAEQVADTLDAEYAVLTGKIEEIRKTLKQTLISSFVNKWDLYLMEISYACQDSASLMDCPEFSVCSPVVSLGSPLQLEDITENIVTLLEEKQHQLKALFPVIGAEIQATATRLHEMNQGMDTIEKLRDELKKLRAQRQSDAAAGHDLSAISTAIANANSAIRDAEEQNALLQDQKAGIRAKQAKLEELKKHAENVAYCIEMCMYQIEACVLATNINTLFRQAGPALRELKNKYASVSERARQSGKRLSLCLPVVAPESALLDGTLDFERLKLPLFRLHWLNDKGNAINKLRLDSQETRVVI